MIACMEPQAHPDRCGCEPEAPVGYVSGDRFHAEHERLREYRKERDQLRADNERLALAAQVSAQDANAAERENERLRGLVLDYRNALRGERYPDNDEGDYLHRQRDIRIKQIDAALAGKGGE